MNSMKTVSYSNSKNLRKSKSSLSVNSLAILLINRCR